MKYLTNNMLPVVKACWHGKLSTREAEERLRTINKSNAYLIRESDIRSKQFVLSYLSDKNRGLCKHVIVPTLLSRKPYSNVNEAATVMERMILTSDHCEFPVPLPDPDENGNTSQDTSADDGPASDLACSACHVVCDSKEKLRKHNQSHFVIECEECHKFISRNSYHSHSLKCKNIPLKVHSCDQCDFQTNWLKNLRKHKKRVHVEMEGIQCNICRNKEMYKRESKVNQSTI